MPIPTAPPEQRSPGVPPTTYGMSGLDEIEGAQDHVQIPDLRSPDPFPSEQFHAASEGTSGTEEIAPEDVGISPNLDIPANAPDRSGDFAPASAERTSSAPAWNVVAQIAKRARIMMGKDRSVANIRLEPEALGVVRMKVVTEGTTLSVRISVENPEVKHILESNIAHLKETLTFENMRAEKIEVFVGGGDLSEGSPRGGDPRTMWSGGRSSAPFEQTDEKLEDTPIERTYIRAGSEGRMVDYLG